MSHYPEQKIKKITDTMKRTLIANVECLGDEDEMIEQLMEKFIAKYIKK